jgi:hypothetical protein
MVFEAAVDAADTVEERASLALNDPAALSVVGNAGGTP